MRLFLAIVLPTELKEEIYHSCLSIQKNCFRPYQFPLLKWTSKEQMHITQHFLGNVEEAALLEVKEILSKVIQQVSSFSLSTEGLCWQPGESPAPKMIWLKFMPAPEFTTLSNSIYESLSALIPDLEKPKQPVIPHVTLIRLKKVKPFTRKLNELKTHYVDVGKIELWQSFLDSNGAKYEYIGTFFLNNLPPVQ